MSERPTLMRRLTPHLPALKTAARRGLTSLAAIWALTWLVAPPILRWQIEQQATEALGRQVTVEQVTVKPWSLEVTLRDLRIAHATGTSTQASIGSLSVNADFSSLLRLAPVLDSVQVERPLLNLTHLGQGAHDVQDVIDKLSGHSEPPPPDTPPARFAVYNIELRDGQVNLHDVPADNHHTLTDITLAVPFISTLHTARDVRVSPRLAFKLNGSPFDTTANTQPFHDQLTTEAKVVIDQLDLAPYLDYLPKDLPVRPAQATLGAELAISFSQQPHPKVSIGGRIHAKDVALTDAHGQPVLRLVRGDVVLTDLRPLERTAQLGAVTLESPELALHRQANGQLNTQPKTPENAAINPIIESVGDKNSYKNDAGTQQPATGWSIGLSALQLTDGKVRWTDDTSRDTQQQPARLALDSLRLDAHNVRWPLSTDTALPTTFEAAATFTGHSPAATATHAVKAKRATSGTAATGTPRKTPTATPEQPTSIGLSGSALASQADARLHVSDLQLPQLAPYLRSHLTPTVQGLLTLRTHITWKPAAAPGAQDDITIALPEADLRRFKLTNREGTETASVQALVVRDALVRPLERTANLGHITLTRPALPIQRDAAGQWMAAHWLVPATLDPATGPSTETSARTQPTPADSTGAQTTWTWELPGLTVTDGQFSWSDGTTTPTAALQAAAVKLSVQGLRSRGGPDATVQADLRVGTGQAESGSLNWRGAVNLGDDGQTPRMQGTLAALRLPVHALAPYAASRLNFDLLQADASFDGRLTYSTTSAGPAVQLDGHATVENLRANTLATQQAEAEAWLRWKSLNLRGIALSWTPQAPPDLSVERGALSDFFARIAIDSTGRINLQDILKPTTTDATAGPAPVATATEAAPRLRIGPLSLVNGAVDFSDRFIRPNYRANLSELTGRIGGFSSDGAAARVDGRPAPDMADVELRGKAEGTASLDITGKLNPLANPLALAIDGRVRNLELPPLSPYTVKYTGHGIERGKLSLDVRYTILPDGQLTAQNQLTLNQLTFGDPVPDAPASLPVKLATALLSDRHGVIDLNLPITGSLNDPEFRLAPVIFKILGNLITKAITAPFALLTAGGGEGDNSLDHLAFTPGTNVPLPESAEKLNRLTQALTDRPALSLTVTGTASLDADRTAYQRERLLKQVLAEHQRLSPGTATDPTSNWQDSPAYLRALTSLYRKADIPKPRHALGMVKELPAADMEALLLPSIAAGDAQMRELATQRGEAVRDSLVQAGVPPQRVFLGAATTAVTPDQAGRSHMGVKLSLVLK